MSDASRQRGVVSHQVFWVGLALFALCVVMTFVSPAFTSPDNVFNTTRNLAFIGLLALGQTAVILTAGIDLSVGSVLGLSGIVIGLTLGAGHPLEVGVAAGVGTALLCGLVNGALIAYVGLSPFVVTLGTLSIGRSLALVVSQNRMVYEFGPDQEALFALGGGRFLGLANPVWFLLGFALLFGWLFRGTRWGLHLRAIGGNETAARVSGVPVARVKLLAYVASSAMAGLTAVLLVGWLGSVTNALGQGYELRVIAASVIGGANLMGGEGGALGAVVGAALVEVIRNSLLLAGVDPYWQGTFVGAFIILAVVLDWKRSRRGR